MKYTYNGEKVDGSNPMMPGTNVKPECNTTIYKIKNPETYRPKILNCLPSGYWSDEINFRCVPSNLFYNFNLMLKVNYFQFPREIIFKLILIIIIHIIKTIIILKSQLMTTRKNILI